MKRWIWRMVFGVGASVLCFVIDNLLLGNNTSGFIWAVIGMTLVDLADVKFKVEERRY